MAEASSLPPQDPLHLSPPNPSSSTDNQMGPFFFTFRPTAAGSPVTVPGFFVPMQWPPPPSAARTQPRAGSSFVFTEFGTDAHPRPHPVWTGANLSTNPSSSSQRAHLSRISPPTPGPIPSGTTPYATWSSGQQGITLVVSINPSTGQVNVAPPRPTGPSSSPGPSYRSTGVQHTSRPASRSRTAQTCSAATTPPLIIRKKSAGIQSSGSDTLSPPANRSGRRPALPTDWLVPSAKSSHDSVSVRSAAGKPPNESNSTFGPVESPGGKSTGDSTPARTLRRMGTFYRSKENTPLEKKPSPTQSLKSKSSTWSFSRRQIVEDSATSTRGLLGLLGIKKSPKSSASLQDVTNVLDDDHRGPTGTVRAPSAASERVLYPRAPMSSTPPAAGTSRHQDAENPVQRENSPPFHVRNDSGLSIPSIPSVETLPTCDVIPANHLAQSKSSPSYSRSLGRAELDRVNNKLEQAFSGRAARPDVRSAFDESNVPQPPERSSQESNTSQRGAHLYDLSLPPRPPVYTPNGTMCVQTTLSSPMDDSPTLHRSFNSLPRRMNNAPHIFDLDHDYSGRATSVPAGYVNADDVTLSPPKGGGGGGRIWGDGGWPDPQEFERSASLGSGNTSQRSSRPPRPANPHMSSMSREAYVINTTTRSDILQLFSNDSAIQGRAWADLTQSTASHTSKQARALSASQRSNGTQQAAEQSSRLDQSQKSQRSNEQSFRLDQSQGSNKSMVNGNPSQAHTPLDQSQNSAQSPSDHSQAISDESKVSSANGRWPGEAEISDAIIGAAINLPDEVDQSYEAETPWDEGPYYAWLQQEQHRWDDDGLTTILEDDELAAQSPQSSARPGSRTTKAGSTTITRASSTSGSTARP